MEGADQVNILSRLDIIHKFQHSQRKLSSWKPPQSGWMKVNTEASLTDDSPAIGGLFRDEFGTAHSAFSFIVNMDPIYLLELRAIERAIRSAISFGF